jgi:uncharacterized BrkB/YihY/UPF0761 family membrane protein
MNKKAKQKRDHQSKEPAKRSFFVFKKINFLLLIASVVIITIGFIIMSIGKEMPFDAAHKITIAPIIVLTGLLVGLFSILYTPKEAEDIGNKDS